MNHKGCGVSLLRKKIFENKWSCDDNSEDDGLCDGDSDLKKILYKNTESSVLQKDSKLVQKKFMCGNVEINIVVRVP